MCKGEKVSVPVSGETVTSAMVPFPISVPSGPTHTMIGISLMSGCSRVTLQVRVNILPATAELSVLTTSTTGSNGAVRREREITYELLYYVNTDSLVTLTGMEVTAGSLATITFCTTLMTAAVQVRFVSAVLRGERVRVE